MPWRLKSLPGPPASATRSRAWLRNALAPCPRPAHELRQEAADRGIGRNALYAARKAEGIIIAKEHTSQGRWIWTLDGTADSEDPSPPGTREVQHL